MQVPSAIAIMPPEPIDEPAPSTDSLSSVRLAISAAVSTLVEMPPGMTHFSAAPCIMPPQSSSMNVRHG